MRNQIKSFFMMPPQVQSAFQQDALRKNRLSLLVICIMIIGMELFNIARVLFWSKSGLGTLNNRIYFGLYCLLLVVSVLYLLLCGLLRQMDEKIRWRLQYGMALFALLWHVCINAYDLMRNPEAQTGIYTTAVLGLAVFIQMPSLYCLATYVLAYGLFMVLAGPILDTGALVNLTITTIVALAVSLTSCRHAVIMISQRIEMTRSNQRLHELSQMDPLTGLLNTTAFRHRVEQYLAASEPTSMIALIMLDMDDFKAVNDGFGHPCGDYVLKVIALKLQAQFPDALGIARIGGDEFMIALVDTSGAEINKAASQLIRDVTLLRWRGQDMKVCCSLGVCRARASSAYYDTLYEIADQALYQAKADGKGRCILRELVTAKPDVQVQYSI